MTDQSREAFVVKPYEGEIQMLTKESNCTNGTLSRCTYAILLLVALMSMAFSSTVLAQGVHGIGIAKGCQLAEVQIGELVDCRYTLENNIDTGTGATDPLVRDTLTIDELIDAMCVGGKTPLSCLGKGGALPPTSPDLIPLLSWTFSGGAYCDDGTGWDPTVTWPGPGAQPPANTPGSTPFARCWLPQDSMMQSADFGWYTAEFDDADPLEDIVTVRWQDTGDSGAGDAPDGNGFNESQAQVDLTCDLASLACSADDFCNACNETTNLCEVANIGAVCNDPDQGDQCIPDLCEEDPAGIGQCVEDNGVQEACDPLTSECNIHVCDTSDGVCKPEANPAEIGEICNDPDQGDLCIPDLCEENAAGVGECIEDNDLANEETCDTLECGVCVTGTGLCVVDEEDPACLGLELCRTPGFWGSRGGYEGDGFYTKGQNVTGEVIGDGLLVCGTLITGTMLGDGQSATEAICIKGGDPRAKMMRMLMSASLNCALGDCSANTSGLVAYCNDVCANEVSADYGMCHGSLGCFNEGGHINADGSCVPAGEFACTGTDTLCDPADPVECNFLDGEECVSYESCHERMACPDLYDDGEINDSADCFEPLGAASSPGKCNAARKTTPYIFDLPNWGVDTP
jgi:hypothetical protein